LKDVDFKQINLMSVCLLVLCYVEMQKIHI